MLPRKHKMNIICKNLGNAKKHNEQILEHNRLKSTAKVNTNIVQI